MQKDKVLLLMIAALFYLMTGCGTQSEDQETTGAVPTEQPAEEQVVDFSNEENPIVTITMENDEEIMVELYPEVAPNTVANFISLIETGYYDGVIFHRVIPGFMIQGGDPVGNGSGGPGYSIAGEYASNDFENPLAHHRGVISMARSGEPNSAGSQFFIMTEQAPHLDGEYAAFGKVVEGMETVDAIVNAKTKGEKPIEDQIMKTVTVDTKGIDYPDPVIIE
ncbi:peptidylprolyl isomerase [Bacillus sp. YZJH907-2]|uniref:Peptidyl-prolyl cis-trans isomerase n=2 Tax=Halalkalibacter suaedae TaxID=2822140 RepID=A0A940WT27_9BACI|nr:peptidylprolyl isomerase [Bacillus suaedae]